MSVMKKYLLLGVAIASSVLSSCYYDPFVYGNTQASFGVSSFGNGYSSSVFVSTGDPRWAYDPYRYLYFDRYRSCYYDPFLYGYYPVGYLPVAVRGCPHPYNWSGVGVCPPPRTVRSNTLSRYDNRVGNYHAANYHWARRVEGSGSSTWMSTSQRSQLTQRATQARVPDSGSSSPSWMNGGLNRGSSSGSSMFNSNSTPSRGGLSTGIWGNSPGVRGSTMTPRTTTRQTPDIQPRPTSGGMFGGLDRSSRSSSSTMRSPSVAPSMPAPRIESTPAPSRSLPSTRSSFDGGSSGGFSPRGSSSGGISPGGGSSGGGLRRFQR